MRKYFEDPIRGVKLSVIPDMNGGGSYPTPAVRLLATLPYLIPYCDFKGARYSYRSVVLRIVLSLSARRPQIDLRPGDEYHYR